MSGTLSDFLRNAQMNLTASIFGDPLPEPEVELKKDTDEMVMKIDIEKQSKAGMKYQDIPSVKVAEAAIKVWEAQIAGLRLEREALVDRAMGKKDQLDAEAQFRMRSSYAQQIRDSLRRGYDRYDRYDGYDRYSTMYPPRLADLSAVQRKWFPTDSIDRKIIEIQSKIDTKNTWLQIERGLPTKPEVLVWLDNQVEEVARWDE